MTSESTNTNSDAFQQAVRAASIQDPNTFHNWFDQSGGDVDANFNKGQCEFAFYFLMPLLTLLRDTKNKTALEIGYGGGRLLAAASHVFGKVIGVDVHLSPEMVIAQLAARNIFNYELHNCTGQTIPLTDRSVDFVYSFLVLQHIGHIATFNRYVSETHRVLKDNGYAILFFGRLFCISKNRSANFLYHMDRLLERIAPIDYREIPAPVNHTNLRISLSYAKQLSHQNGFAVLGEGASRKLPRIHVFGGQSFLILRKANCVPLL